MELKEIPAVIQTSKTLRRVRMANADFANPDGSEVVLDRDYFGNRRSAGDPIGPIAAWSPGVNRIKVW